MTQRSAFIAVMGRPNVGKSSLVNRLCGHKVSIVASSANTTRRQVRGIRTDSETQLIFVDTPGIHRPKTELGRRLNLAATEASEGVDIHLVVIDATKDVGPGDTRVLEITPSNALVVLNKCDIASKPQIAKQLMRLGEFNKEGYFPVSSKTGYGVDALLAELKGRCVDPYLYYPDEMLSDQDELFRISEIVREKLLVELKDELPHSIYCTVTEYDPPHVCVEIVVERESQKPIVIGKGGGTLKKVGIAAREELGGRLFLELFVKVERNWQRNSAFLDGRGL
ncbi:GTP-binding protein Era [Ferrithrix thermotolerans DSM 19514]|uniref:GTPase Era n=1 Tax=Ferrithrix thermotolerans DSM 19514 TaxID=1121881 RepID=A0A1M4UT41_9ACTN|nr:GTPase Era [Ferrithrix thermotolerans]SHE59770.1 GTP-binding protein Era [Ferrithrix thermotolerans DSM 19514]